MFGFLLASMLLAAHGHGLSMPSQSFVLAQSAENRPAITLRQSIDNTLMGKVHAMNEAGDGIFQEDVSAIVAPYFPAGQSYAETQKIIREQQLGELKKFKGMQDPAGGTMYVTRFDLMSGIVSKVYVVLNFDFTGSSEADMVVKKTSAYLRADSM